LKGIDTPNYAIIMEGGDTSFTEVNQMSKIKLDIPDGKTVVEAKTKECHFVCALESLTEEQQRAFGFIPDWVGA
jgi:hypothetical protein